MKYGCIDRLSRLTLYQLPPPTFPYFFHLLSSPWTAGGNQLLPSPAPVGCQDAGGWQAGVARHTIRRVQYCRKRILDRGGGAGVLWMRCERSILLIERVISRLSGNKTTSVVEPKPFRRMSKSFPVCIPRLFAKRHGSSHTSIAPHCAAPVMCNAQAKVQKLQRQEILMVNIGSTASGGKVLAVKQDLAKILLTQPVCTQEGEKIALSRRVDKVRSQQLRMITKVLTSYH